MVDGGKVSDRDRRILDRRCNCQNGIDTEQNTSRQNIKRNRGQAVD